MDNNERTYAVVKLACAARFKEHSPELSDADCVKLATIAMEQKQAQAQPNSVAPAKPALRPDQIRNRAKARQYAEAKDIGPSMQPLDVAVQEGIGNAIGSVGNAVRGLFKRKTPAPAAPALGKSGGVGDAVREWWRNGANNPVNRSIDGATKAIKSVPSRLGRTRFAKGLQKAVVPTTETDSQGIR